MNNAIPDAQISAMPGLCIGEQNNISFTGTADPSATYNWSFGSGTVNSGSGAGPYNVQWAAAGTAPAAIGWKVMCHGKSGA